MVGTPRKSPKKNSGTCQGHPGRLGRFMRKFQFKGQNVRGTDGTHDGTDGTCPWDRWTRTRAGPAKNSFCLLVFSFPINIFEVSTPLTLSPPPCPTCQLWPFSSAKENHPKMPIFGWCADVWEKDVWEFQAKSGAQVLAVFSFSSLDLGKNRSSRNVWESAWKSQTSFFQTSVAF